MSEKTGWTLDQITNLTVKQLNAYILEWSSEENSKDISEVERFNFLAGVKSIKKKK